MERLWEGGQGVDRWILKLLNYGGVCGNGEIVSMVGVRVQFSIYVHTKEKYQRDTKQEE